MRKFMKFEIIGKSPNFLKVLEMAKKVRGKNINILLQGETGTGKELLAQYIHHLENDDNRPFVSVNCAAIPETLFESEFFGHEAGSFTGAIKQHIGKFELADGGDLFLDEIHTLKSELQCKLLRVIQEREFYRVGGTQPVKVNVRLISASSIDLQDAMERDQFRQDFFYRLKVFSLTLPPLRKRTEDIPILAEYFLSLYGHNDVKKFSDEAMECIKNYYWPGNIREFKHMMEAVLLASDESEITKDDLSEWIQTPKKMTSYDEDFSKNHTLKGFLKKIKKEYVQQCIKNCDGNAIKAAQILKIGRSTIYQLLK